MLEVKRSSLSALAIGIAATLVGCSDYPSEGVIDTKELRSLAKIVEVEGNVYGIKMGALDAYGVYEHDRNALNNAEYDAWEAYRKGESIPKIELKYEGDRNGFDLAAFRSAIDDAIAEAVKEVEAEIAEDIAEAQENRVKVVAEIEEVSKGGEKFEAYVADAKAEYEAAKKALNNAIEAYNAEIERPVQKMNEIAEANGLEKVGSRQNPIRSYRTIDFSNRSMPSSCPRQAGYTAVNLLDEQKTGGYVRLPSRFEPHSSEVVQATKTALINIPKAEATLGEKGGWGSNGSGAYETVELAEDTYKERASEARSKFGNDLQRKRKLEYLNRNLERVESEIARLEAEDHRSQIMAMTRPDLPENVEESADNYIDGVYANLTGYIEKGPEITLGEKNAVFSGFNGDYEGAIAVADFIVEDGSRRENLATLNYLNLMVEEVKNGDALNFELNRESFSDGRRIDIREPESIEKAIIKCLNEQERQRERARNA